VSAYASLDIPTLILRGEHALGPSRLIVETLSTLMPAARMTVIPGAGHMGPITHSGAVNLEILRHIAASERTFQQREPATSHPAFAASRAVA
jgi:pimeloyl-ACP methyl ester carboxylesterase